MIPGVQNIIKREIEFMFGRRIVGARDCIQLSDEIFRITKSRLNANTLRRFFGVVKTSYSPSPSTIQILCNYCGFTSINDLDNYNGRETRELDSPEQKDLLQYLVNLFRETPVESKSNETFKSIVKQTILFLSQHHWLIDPFQLMVAKTKNGQDYYFEGFVNIDRLNSYYGNGLRYYLNEKETVEAQIFYYSLLVFKHWLTENAPEMEQNFQKLAGLSIDGQLSYNVSGRYFASLVYYEYANNLSSGGTTMRISEYHIAIGETDQVAQVYYDVVIAEALVLTGNYEEGLFYCSMALKNAQHLSMNDESILQHLYVLEVFAMCKLGDERNAAVYYKRIRPTDFSFLNKRMLTVLYDFVTNKLRKNAGNIRDYSTALIEETGFSKLGKLISLNTEMKITVDSG